MANPFLDHDSSNYGSKQSQLQETRSKVLDSQKNALRSLYNSEQVGVATANELMDQGEKLDRTNQRLDEIAEKQKVSDKHIKNLNSGFVTSLFGLFKKKEAPTQTISSKDRVYDTYRDPNLSQVVTAYKPTESSRSNDVAEGDGSDYRKQFDNNLDDMSKGVNKLNTLAKGLGSELDRQNKLLEEMTPKTDKINTTMATQNKQLNVLLYGKPK